MLAIEKWVQRKDPTVAFFALQLAMVAREQCEALLAIKERRVYGHKFTLPDLPSWFSLYLKPRKVLRAYARFISLSEDTDKENYLLLRKLHKQHLKNITKAGLEINSTPVVSNEPKKDVPNPALWVVESIKHQISATTIDPEQKEKIFKIMTDDDLPLGFYLLVYLPCHLFYQMSSTELYRKALDRDVTALENLLKLDPLMINDPAIGYQIQTLRLQGKQNDYEKVIGAVMKMPTTSYSDISKARMSVKSDYGALIAAIAEALHKPLKMPEIRRLYDALAKDFEGTEIDPDIKNPESFDKTIKTKMIEWQNKFQLSEKQK